MLEIEKAWPDLGFTGGVGSFEDHEVCVMSGAVAEWRLRNGEDLGAATDQLECVCPVLRVLAIRVNDGDWGSPEAHKEWALEMIPKLLGTANAEATQARAEFVAWKAIKVYAPKALRAAGLDDQAAILEGSDEGLGLRAAGDAAWDAGAAAWAAAGAAAWDAAGAAAWDAAGAAAVRDLLDDVLAMEGAQ